MTISEALDLAVREHTAGRLPRAEQLYRSILQVQPRHADALHLLGVIADQVERRDEAVELIQRAIAIDPAPAVFHANLARIFYLLRRFSEAAESAQRALERRPDFAEVWNTLGLTRRELQQPASAEEALRRAVALRPDFAEAHNNLGLAAKDLGRLEDAAQSMREALRLQPDFAEAYSNLGLMLAKLDHPEEAIACCRRALELKPNLSDAHSNLGFALASLERFDEAMQSLRHVLSVEPQHADARQNLALVLLLLGRFEEGWPLYEARLERQPPAAPPEKRWRGEALGGRTLLLTCEQGYGDTIHFARYAPLFHERAGAARVVLECQAGLFSLLCDSFAAEPAIAIRRAEDFADRPAFDFHLPLMSAPLALGLAEPHPIARPYITATPGLREKWRARLGAARGRRVGLVWKGSPRHGRDRMRSIPCAAFLKGLRVAKSGDAFYSLQLGASAEEAALLRTAGVTDLTAELTDFAETAALLAELDLLIAVDTAPIHLAGALGIPAWLLLPISPDWRWGARGETTPWYPSLRLFRQEERSVWEPVLGEVRAQLHSGISRGESDY